MLTHGFGPKMAIFPSFFLFNICQENVFYDILERKYALLGFKNLKVKKSKNEDFSFILLFHGFCQKSAISLSFDYFR